DSPSRSSSSAASSTRTSSPPAPPSPPLAGYDPRTWTSIWCWPPIATSSRHSRASAPTDREEGDATMSLPEGLKFLQIGWWISHALTVWLLYTWAYRRGRNDERKAQREKRTAASASPPPPAA